MCQLLFWLTLLSAGLFPQTFTLIQIHFTLPVGTATGSFSQMKVIKKRLRN